ncbi:hypothetical protein AB0M57_04815 [Streptomyces sp. NPDC051597]|uniref:hypothetical protein n=1 Tax=Streptomyces sp. NPDC051597 TaxID=3155049 RepID=UPI0034272E8A
MATDSYGQSITLPALTDEPNIATVAAALSAVLARSVLSFASATARNATLTSPVEGMTAWLQDVNQLTQYNGSGWVTVPLGGTWTAYTPAWTAASTNPVLGNGTLQGRYMQVGTTVTFAIKITAGSTTTFGSGAWSLSLPTTPANNIDMIGHCMVGDASAGTSGYSNGAAYIAQGTNTVSPYAGGKQDMAIVTSLGPMTWATGDRLWVSGTYETA